MRTAFITYRSHPNEQQLTDYFITIILSKIKEVSEVYCIAQENYGTPSHHIHILFEHSLEEDQKFQQKFLLHKKAVEFYESIKPLQTKIVYTGKAKFKGSTLGGTSYGLDSQWDISKKENSDPKYYIGYCHKDPNTQHDIKGYSQHYVGDSIKYFYTVEGMKCLKPSENLWRILNTRNAHSYIQDFCKKNKIILDDDLNENLLQQMMASQGVSVVELSHNKYGHIIQDLIDFHKGIPLCDTITQLKHKIEKLEKSNAEYQHLFNIKLAKNHD